MSLAILFYSANQKPEPFASKVRASLLDTIGDLPLVSVTQGELDFGQNINVGQIGASTYNCYKQILIGAQAATTRFIACAEDDVLSPVEHYQFRPPRDDTFYYDKNRWWVELNDRKPRYRWRNRTVMSTCVCNRELFIEWAERLFKKFPKEPTREGMTGWAEPGRYETYLKLPQVKISFFSSQYPMLTFNTKPSLGGVRRPQSTDTTCNYLEPWGFASDVWEKYIASGAESG